MSSNSTRHCPNCGREVRPGANYCPYCNTALNAAPAAPASPPPPSVTAPVAPPRGSAECIGRYRVLEHWPSAPHLSTVELNGAQYLAIHESRPLNTDAFTKLTKFGSHANFVPACDEVEEGHQTYLIVRFIEGGLLSDLPVPMTGAAQASAIAIFNQVLIVLNALHNSLDIAFSRDRLGGLKTGWLERWFKSFMLTPNGRRVVLFDYSLCEPARPEDRERKFKDDLSLSSELINWLLTGKRTNLLERLFRGPRRFFGLFRARPELPEARFDYAESGEMLYQQTARSDPGKTVPLPRGADSTTRKLTDLHLEVHRDTDNGKERDHNEDHPFEQAFNLGALYIVADGMGGHAAGEVASELAITTIAHLAEAEWEELLKEFKPQAVQARLNRWIQQANAEIIAKGQALGNDMGTTVTLALVVRNQLYTANVGDSRTYLYRIGELYQLTRDHSLVASLVAAKLIQPEEVYDHPQRNQIFRSLGHHASLDVDVFDPIELTHEDQILLCSDGLWEMVRTPQLKEILARRLDPAAACRVLIQSANDNGGEDNISVVLARVTFG